MKWPKTTVERNMKKPTKHVEKEQMNICKKMMTKREEKKPLTMQEQNYTKIRISVKKIRELP